MSSNNKKKQKSKQSNTKRKDDSRDDEDQSASAEIEQKDIDDHPLAIGHSLVVRYRGKLIEMGPNFLETVL